MFGSGIYRTWDYTFDTWSASGGANFRLTDRSAIYGRVSRGTRMPTPQQWTFQTTDGSQITGDTKRGEVETTMQAELGVKTSADRWSLLLTGFYGTSKSMLVTLDRGQPNGGFAFLPISTDTRTVGAEIEGRASPARRGSQLGGDRPCRTRGSRASATTSSCPGNNPLSGAQTRDYSGQPAQRRRSASWPMSARRTRWRGAEIFGDYRYSGNRPGEPAEHRHDSRLRRAEWRRRLSLSSRARATAGAQPARQAGDPADGAAHR